MHGMSSDEINTMLDRFVVDHDHKVILKSIPKSGCSSWKSILIMNSITVNKLYTINPHNWDFIVSKYHLSVLNKKNYTHQLNTYFLILTVRHPFSRLESGFRDKIVRDQNITTKIDEVFQNFLNTIINHPKDEPMDHHWRPVTWHTKPCALPLK